VSAAEQLHAKPAKQLFVPKFAMQENWGDYGSCTYAATVAACLFQGEHETARYVRANFVGGASYYEVANIFASRGIRYCGTTWGSVELLRWASDTRRFMVIGCDSGGACVPYSPSHIRLSDGRIVKNSGHAMVLVHFDDERVGLYDSNHCIFPSNSRRIRWVSTADFLKDWQGWAITPVSQPCPPRSIKPKS
jgi:hypothetical protein